MGRYKYQKQASRSPNTADSMDSQDQYIYIIETLSRSKLKPTKNIIYSINHEQKTEKFSTNAGK